MSQPDLPGSLGTATVAPEVRNTRRSPRKAASIPLWLRQEQGRIWEEETETRMLSRYGAGVECRRLVAPGSTLAVVRRDNGQRAQARVVYCRYNAQGHREMGLEFLHCDNFWDLDWSFTEPVPTSADDRAPEPPQIVIEPAAVEPAKTKRRDAERVAELLVAQESKLWEAIGSKDLDALETLLADDALWVSADGVQDKRAQLAQWAETDSTGSAPADFRVIPLNKTSAIVTSVATAGAAYHTSVWVRRGGRWRVVLHQITPAR